MNDERLSRHLQNENADLKSENSRLKMQTEAQENKIQEKDSEVLRLLNQIATDMIRKSDVDRLVEEAVAKATAALKADYEERMKAMAAEYEAKIAELQNQKDGKGDDKDETPGKSTKNSKKKGGTVICNSMEEAMQRIQEEMNKAAVMQDQAFGGGSEKLSSEMKPAVNPEEENADDDSKVQSPVNPRGDYGERNNESKPRPEEYSNYIKVDKEDEITVDCYPEGCNENSKKYGKRTNVIWELSLPKLKKMLVNLYRCKVNGKKVWAKMPNRDMYQDLLYYANTATAKCGELLMKAINYAKAEWKGLIRYTEDGKYRVDNNAAESIMRDLACGRKNFLFCGSDNAAMNLAFAYSLTESCKLNNINPYDYWSDLIDFIGCEGIDLNSFVHSQWHKHTKAA